MLKEFKTFVMRGNVLDMAVAVIIGGVFGKILSSLMNEKLDKPLNSRRLHHFKVLQYIFKSKKPIDKWSFYFYTVQCDL
jgi:large conductance mechanosensitive channel